MEFIHKKKAEKTRAKLLRYVACNFTFFIDNYG